MYIIRGSNVTGHCCAVVDSNQFHYTRGADKSLAQTERKQTTATKLGIYSTYSPQSSIHFVARCSNLCKPPDQFRTLSVQLRLRDSNGVREGRKMATFQLLFLSREQVVVRCGQIRRIGWVIKIFEAQVGQFLLGCKFPVSRALSCKNMKP